METYWVYWIVRQKERSWCLLNRKLLQSGSTSTSASTHWEIPSILTRTDTAALTISTLQSSFSVICFGSRRVGQRNPFRTPGSLHWCPLSRTASLCALLMSRFMHRIRFWCVILPYVADGPFIDRIGIGTPFGPPTIPRYYAPNGKLRTTNEPPRLVEPKSAKMSSARDTVRARTSRVVATLLTHVYEPRVALPANK